MIEYKNLYILPTNSVTMAKQKTAWNIHLMKVYKDMKDKNSKIKLSDAMKVAKASYKK
jgi:hypothetical protein